MIIFKIVFVSVLCVLGCVLLRQNKPEFLPLMHIAYAIVIVILFVDYIENILEYLTELSNGIGIIEDGYITLLIKILGVAILTKITTDISRDNGNSTIASCVELCGKVTILAMCIPFIRIIVQLAEGLLE